MSSKLLRVVVSSIFLANKFGNFLNMKLVLSLKFEVKLLLVRYLFRIFLTYVKPIIDSISPFSDAYRLSYSR